MSLYSQYVKERENRECIEDSDGFATFKILGTECYLIDVYVVPDKRRSNKATELADKVYSLASDRGCKLLTTTVCPSSNNSTNSLSVIISYGFKLIKSEPNLIWFAKEIK